MPRSVAILASLVVLVGVLTAEASPFGENNIADDLQKVFEELPSDGAAEDTQGVPSARFVETVVASKRLRSAGMLPLLRGPDAYARHRATLAIINHAISAWPAGGALTLADRRSLSPQDESQALNSPHSSSTVERIVSGGLTSPFSHASVRRSHSLESGGLRFDVAIGHEIRAPASGEVISVEPLSAGTHRVTLSSSDSLSYAFDGVAMLSVVVGDIVEGGERIGLVGSEPVDLHISRDGSFLRLSGAMFR